MLNKPIDQIDEDDLKRLLDQEYEEGKYVDYKKTLWRLEGKSDKTALPKARIEFLKDVSSFANCEGGCLLVGIEEEEGKPTAIPGIEVANTDDKTNQLDQLLQSWIRPRLSTEIRFIPLENGKLVLLIRVESSRIGPHRVCYDNHGHYYSRNSTGAYHMDTEELRDSFTSANSLVERIRGFRANRVSLIETQDLPLPVLEEPRMIMHLVPESSFTSQGEFTIDALLAQQTHLGPPSMRSWDARPNLEGIVTYGHVDQATGRFVGCAQLYRTGIIEAAFTQITFANRSGKAFWSKHNEMHVLQSLSDYMGCLSSLGVAPPIWVFLTLSRMDDVYHMTGDGKSRKFDRPIIKIPEVLIDDLSSPPHEILRPAFDMIWNAMGFRECSRISEDGKHKDLTLDDFVNSQ